MVIGLLVALLFLLPPAAAFDSIIDTDDGTGSGSIPSVDNEEIPDIEDPDPSPDNEGETGNSDSEGTMSNVLPDTDVRTKSTVMVVSKIGLHDKDEDPVDELDDGEEGKISAEVTNDGAKQDVMTDVEVDFYFVDKDDEEYYIDTDIIPYIEGDGNSSIAMVDWTADMLALKIKVVADVDGSDGGPGERYQDVNITKADYAHKLLCA